MNISCRNCGQIKPRYEGTSWCVDCVNGELAVQELERFAPEFPDVYAEHAGTTAVLDDAVAI